MSKKSKGRTTYYSSRLKGDVCLTHLVTVHSTAKGAEKELKEYGFNTDEWEVVRVEVTPV